MSGNRTIAGWIAYLDLYAFSADLTDEQLGQTTRSLSFLYKRASQLTRHVQSLVNFRAFSDTMVLWVKHDEFSQDGLNVMLDLLSNIVDIAAELGFIFRGAVSFGDIIVSSNFVLGDAYLRAYKLAEFGIIDPIIVIPKSEIERSCILYKDSYQYEEIVLKKDQRESVIQVPSPSWEAAERIARKYSSRSSDSQADVWGRLLARSASVKGAQ